MKIKDLLKKELMIMDLKATSKLEAINEMVKKLKDEGIISDEEMFKDFILKREEKGTTGLGDGIAMPHAKTTAVKIPAVLFAKSKNGVDYEALDGEPVHIFFMIAATEGAHDSHIETLAKLSKMLINDEFVKELMTCENPDRVHELVDKFSVEEASKEETKIEEKKSLDKPYIIAATACPTGIAHTYMAAEALRKAAAEMGVKIKVETNGADGRKDVLTAEDIEKATGVILAINRSIETDRFDGKPLIQVEAKDGINRAKELIQDVLDGKAKKFVAEKSSSTEKVESADKKGLYKHLLSGVSYMLPLVISGGILIALAFLADTLAGVSADQVQGAYGSTSKIAKILMGIGGAAFGLFVPILGGYIAYSIGERAALAAGLVAGALASSGGSGFLGAMLGGFLAGFVVKALVKALDGIPKSLNGLKMILLYPVLSVLITGTIMVLALNPVVSVVNNALNNWLQTMSGSSAMLLGAILAGMMAIDMGGPINKAAYVFGSGTLAASMATGGSSAMAAVMAGGMVPPIAIALATTLFKNKFTVAEKEAGLSNYVMGFSFITEGAIPYAAADPTKVIPASVIGSAIAGAMTMALGIKIPAPHGGILVMFLSNNFIMYLVSILVGSIVGAVILGIIKKEVK
ncbi:MAG: fructose-specific PTS transporter subunit EIIC [Fusobacterium gastrosuis]|uniref:PTS fructose transporter subunit IIABC n=1 Tax=Fusobacterium gastrosuis TaxID=1755100 RepID=UPI002A960D47|nr:fructose-specific PTS transporter subunit EIIC [Fusobacteriaceae bacterium]MDY5795306.1 fructose-specific PTS transporter subunit EIIC [Fusobacterium gastrosuis]